MEEVLVLSLNVKGLNTPEKRRILLQDIKRSKAGIAMIQETHFRRDSAPSLRDSHFPFAYFSHNRDSKSKGVAILLSRHLPWQLLDSYHSDDGRMLFLKGRLGQRMVTLANLYLPNTHQYRYMRKALDVLSSFGEGVWIVGGDLNLPLNAHLDTSSGSSSVPLSQRQQVVQLLHYHQLIDIWRLQHPRERDYTYFSPPHQSYSRIDYLLVRHSDCSLITSTSIGTATWSDHAPIFAAVSLASTLVSRPWNWKLNESLLSDPGTLKFLTDEMQFFFQTNAPSCAHSMTLWETHKAYMRGLLIRKASELKRLREAKLAALLQSIHALEMQNKAAFSAQLQVDLALLRDQVKDLLLYKAKASLIRCRKAFYEGGDKCGKMLARALRDQRLLSYVPKIRAPGQPIVTDPKEVADSFRSFYAALYNLHSGSRGEDPMGNLDLASNYIEASGLLKLSPQSQALLEAPLSEPEFRQALKGLKPGKAPGPDGFTALYYKSFSEALAPHFLKAFGSCTDDMSLPSEILRATISVIPKEGKDPALCGSYRPISLLNVDLKLFSKIIANRLAPFLPSLVHPDQAGFIPGREAKQNTTKVLNLLHLSKQNSTPCVFLSTDAEKAFDRVSWEFLMQVLCHVGVGPIMKGWISAIYSNPVAAVKVNGTISETFKITNGTRQGCPLSPLLFALYLEPLLSTVRRHPDISGIPMPGMQAKVSAYADDMLFSLTNPLISLPNLLQELGRFGRVANLKINTQKSVAMMVAVPPRLRPTIMANFQFKWTASALPYLGTLMPSDPALTFSLNFPPLFRKVAGLMARWTAKPFSWFGRGNVIKMTIMPKFLYLIAALPVFIPQHFFQKIHSLFTSFIWANKKPRLRRGLMTAPKSCGGLALPDVGKYYLAAHLARVLQWTGTGDVPCWVHLEQMSSSIPLRALPWCRTGHPRAIQSHPTILPTLRVCKSVSRDFNLFSSTSGLYPILGNPSFSPGLQDQPFRALAMRGHFRAAHFISEGRWPSLGTLMDPQGPFALDFWRAMQLSHFLLTLPAASKFVCHRSGVEAWCDREDVLRHSLSLIYKILITPVSSPNPYFLRAWETDLRLTFTEQDRERIFSGCFKSSACTRYQELNYKLLTRWYRTPALLHRFHPGASPNCWRCGSPEGTLIHIFWSCPQLTQFWTAVHTIAQRLTDFRLPFEPAFFLLHLADIPAKAYGRSVVRHLLNAAKACIPLCWSKQEAPSVTLWLQKVEEIRRMEELVSSGRGTQGSVGRTWFYWLEFVSSSEGRSLLHHSAG